MCAKRLLSVAKLGEALAVEPETTRLDAKNFVEFEDMVSSCAGLIMIDEKKYVRLIHYTAQEYLQTTHSTWLPDAHVYITKTCLTYLSFETFSTLTAQIVKIRDELRNRTKSHCARESDVAPSSRDDYAWEIVSISTKCRVINTVASLIAGHVFLPYAAKYWAAHFKEDPSQKRLATSFIRNTENVAMSYWVWQYGEGFRINLNTGRDCRHSYYPINGMLLSAALNIPELMADMMDEKHPNAFETGFPTPLLIGAANGSLSAVELLLGMGLEVVNFQKIPQTFFIQALEAAIKGGHSLVVTTLLEAILKQDCKAEAELSRLAVRNMRIILMNIYQGLEKNAVYNKASITSRRVTCFKRRCQGISRYGSP